MRIPTKIQHGDKVISTVYAKINGIIDYLNASRVKPGTGIRVQETPSGTVVSSVSKTVTPPQLNAGGSGGTIGFPNFFTNSSIAVDDSQQYGPLTEDMWLVGTIASSNYSGPATSYYKMNLQQDASSTPKQIILFSIGDETTQIYRTTFVCVPLVSGLILSFTKDYIGMTASLTLYPSL